MSFFYLLLLHFIAVSKLSSWKSLLSSLYAGYINWKKRLIFDVCIRYPSDDFEKKKKFFLSPVFNLTVEYKLETKIIYIYFFDDYI